MKKQPKNNKEQNNEEFEEKLELEDEDEIEKAAQEFEQQDLEQQNLNSKKQDVENLKIKELEKQILDLKDLNLRLKADFENFKKRTQKEKFLAYDRAKSDCIAPFLEVLDNLERAVELNQKQDKFSQGIDLVISKFYDVLKKIGVLEVQSMGKTFDPNFHEAIKVVEDKNFEKNTICEVFKKGFVLNEVVLRHALVVVANP